MINARKILKDIIEVLDTTLKISKVEAITGGYKLYSCDTMNLSVDKVINYNGSDYSISSIEENEYVVMLTTDVIPTPYPLTAITSPLYFYSTKHRDGMLERAKDQRFQNLNLPFVWIREPYENTISDEFQSYRSFIIDMYILDYCQMVGEGKGVGDAWTTETHHDKVITPLANLWTGRLKNAIVKNYKYISDWQNETVRGLAFVEEDVNKALFNEKLSGINVRIELHFNVQGCEC